MVRELSQAKRELFLQIALKMFAEKGIQNTSTADITREAGTAAGTLFLYFPTKQDLINELAIQISRDEAGRVTSRLDPAMSAREMLEVIWFESIHWLLANPDAFAFSRHTREPGILPESVILETGNLFSFYYEAIQKGLSEGVIKDLSVDLIGGFLYQQIAALMYYIKRMNDPLQQEEVIHQGFNIFWDGIRIPAGSSKEN